MQCIGGGVTEADTITSFLNIDVRSFKLYFTKMEEEISSYKREEGEKQVMKNIAEEAKLLPEDSDGNKQISACTDTAWQKRAIRYRMDPDSGCRVLYYPDCTILGGHD